MSNGLAIMLVDDNKIDLFIHSEVIKRLPFDTTVMQFSFAGDALKYLEASQAWPQVILLDIHMPIMDGFDFLAKYAQLPAALRHTCKVIMLSSSLEQNDLKKAKTNSEVLDFLGKPLNLEKLQELIMP